jgi:hypothetical protein
MRGIHASGDQRKFFWFKLSAHFASRRAEMTDVPVSTKGAFVGSETLGKGRGTAQTDEVGDGVALGGVTMFVTADPAARGA